MGQDFTTNLGLNYRRIMLTGLVIVSIVPAVCLVSVGAIPFLGLAVPNIVSPMGLLHAPQPALVALGGAAFVLACDILGRLIRYP